MNETSAIINRLLEIKEQQEQLEGESKALWKTFYSIADREAGDGEKYRYLDENTGMAIARLVAESGIVDSAKLENVLSHEQWLEVSVAVRSLDMAMLEAAIRKGHVPREKVQECAEKTRTVRRWGPRKATKEELEELAAQEAR